MCRGLVLSLCVWLAISGPCEDRTMECKDDENALMQTKVNQYQVETETEYPDKTETGTATAAETANATATADETESAAKSGPVIIEDGTTKAPTTPPPNPGGASMDTEEDLEALEKLLKDKEEAAFTAKSLNEVGRCNIGLKFGLAAVRDEEDIASITKKLFGAVSPATVLHHWYIGDKSDGFTYSILVVQGKGVKCDDTITDVDKVVEWIEYDGGFTMTGIIVNDATPTEASISWGLDRIDSKKVDIDGKYNLQWGGWGANAYIVDTGLNWGNAEFGGRAVPAFEVSADFEMTACNPADIRCASDNLGHGTSNALVIGGRSMGVAKGCALHGVKVTNAEGAGAWSQVARGMTWVVSNGVRPAIVYSGIAAKGDSKLMETMIDRLYMKGFVTVVPAGAAGTAIPTDSCDVVPGRFMGQTGVFSVGATKYVPGEDHPDDKMEGSNAGDCISIWAPGKDCEVLNHKGEKQVISGASVAAAHVAGAALVVHARNPNVVPYAIFEYLLGRAQNITLGKTNVTNGTHERFLYLPPASANGPNIARWFDPDFNESNLTSDISAQSADEHGEAEESECFPGEALAQVQGRGSVSVSSLQAGDLVLVKQASGELVHEPVLGFLHSINAKQNSFVSVIHSEGEFRASANHIVFVGGQADKPVGDLEVGDKVLAGGIASTVLAIQRALGQQGMYAPITAAGTVVVDGVMASNYAVASLAHRRVPHACAHAILAPVRLYHKLGFAAPQEPVDGLHPFLDVVYRQLRLDGMVALLS